MATQDVLCGGCQNFVDRLFDPRPLKKQFGHQIHLHKNFAELSKCGVESCRLCLFIRRELCYHSSNYESYIYTEEMLQSDPSPVSVSLFVFNSKKPNSLSDVTERSWQYYHGDVPGPSYNGTNRYMRHRSDIVRELDSQVYPDQLLLLSRRWLTKCREEHQKCRRKFENTDSFLPTRLLDVGSPGEPSICLKLSKDLPQKEGIQYTTLSYCWGAMKSSARTTVTNVHERLSSIPIASLPQTLADAVEITRGLGVKYLWIDAFCIIQAENGDSNDWGKEFPSMGRVYRNSLCTIAASGAEHSGIGCFTRREAACWPAQNYLLEDMSREHNEDNPVIVEATMPDWNLAVENSPLSKRGWVLQERMLASRTLFWTKDGLFWECDELHASEFQAVIPYPKTKFPMLHELIDSLQGAQPDRTKIEQSWMNLLEVYSQKGLTVLSDKLPALAGLASELSRQLGLQYEMGLWKHNIVQELAWHADFGIPGENKHADPQATRLPNVPSWSWASMNQKLTFRPGSDGHECEEMVRIDRLESSNQDVGAGEMCIGSLRLRTKIGYLPVQQLYRMMTLSHSQVFPPTACTFEPITYDRFNEEETPEEDDDFDFWDRNISCEVAIFDTLEDTLRESEGTIRCLQWMRWEDTRRDKRPSKERSNRPRRLGPVRYSDWRVKIIGAMIVSVVDENRNIYRRIGWAEFIDGSCDSYFAGDEENITLV